MGYLLDADVFIRAKNLHYGLDFRPAFWDWLVAGWVQSQRYTQSAVSTFLQVADYYLVAQAHAGGYTVVTHEVPSASTRRVKIPDACIGLGIKCVTPYEMLRTERARFVLGPPS